MIKSVLMLCLFIATNCSKLAMDANDVRSSASGTSTSRNADDGRLWKMMSDLSSVVHQQNAKITALTSEVNALKTGYNSPPGSMSDDSEMDGFRSTSRWAERMSYGTDGVLVPYVLRREFKIQQDEINKLRRFIGCYHGIAKPVVYSGTAGASSSWNADYGPEKAFENSDDRWASAKMGDGQRWPELYFNFTSEVAVAMIGLKTLGHGAWGQGPKTFQLLASMDCRDWHLLRNVVDHIWPHDHQGDEYTWPIPCDLIKPWKCYGIRAHAHSGTYYDCVSVKEMKMYTMQGWKKNLDFEGGIEDQANS